MRKGLVILIIGSAVTVIGGGIELIRWHKRKKVNQNGSENLKKEDNDLMEKILDNQAKLVEACSQHEETIRCAVALADELKKRIDELDDGIDPREIDVSIEDFGEVF